MKPESSSPPSPAIASRLFQATIIVTMVGIFLGILFLFSDIPLAMRIAAFFLVGVVGILSWLRHTVFYQSDQARMGWTQEHPQFQMEVGYANLAIGIVALVASALAWGMLAYAMSFFTYGIYLLGALAIHAGEYRADPAARKRRGKSIINTAFFVFFLFVFGILAFVQG
ncbi:MAG TPA: DUF6790 family protein [Methanoregulaceae archaeon]|nr:DUF6790 family protein [Methanoregulaceae archaeon]